jgi:adenylate cyclase
MTVFQAGLNSYYEGDFDNAATFFEQIAGTDPPAQAYLERCRLLISNPPDRWDGVWVVREK